MPLLVPFGLRDGLLYEPLRVENGKRCGCICPGCKHTLIARHNAKTPHFAHAPGEDCANGLETAVHLAAKQLIAERMEIALPAVFYRIPGGFGKKETSEELYESRLVPLSDVCVENWMDGIRPDLIAKTPDGNLLVEIAVTHFSDDKKIAKIATHKIPTIEIDVSSARSKIGFDLLSQMLFQVPSPGMWLFHPQAEELTQRHIAEQQRQRDEWHKAEREQQQRIERYRNLPPDTKIKKHMARAGLDHKKLMALTTFVPWEKSYVGGRLAWQSGVLAYITNQVEEAKEMLGREYAFLEVDDLLRWLDSVFGIEARVAEGEKIALWKYLRFLESRGLLKRSPYQSRCFDILRSPKD